MKRILGIFVALVFFFGLSAEAQTAHGSSDKEKEPVKKVLFIGDSMTGWMAERMEAYGIQNGFEVTTVLWDGSTIAKWATGDRIRKLINRYSPDAVFISLGMNELLERNPEKRLAGYIRQIKSQLGDIPYLWVGPPSWPGKGKGEALNDWLESQLPAGHYFCSSALNLARQSKTNPHPTKAAIQSWMDEVVGFVESAKGMNFHSLTKPSGVQMKRGKVFIYKKMKETL